MTDHKGAIDEAIEALGNTLIIFASEGIDDAGTAETALAKLRALRDAVPDDLDEILAMEQPDWEELLEIQKAATLLNEATQKG